MRNKARVWIEEQDLRNENPEGMMKTQEGDVPEGEVDAHKVVSYEELYGWTMDRIVQQTGRRSNCTFCGVFRRQALDRGAALLEVDKIVTGHNADDIAETVLMNIMRGDVARLQRCTAIVTVRDA
ncbi:Cytoplasmic tRNA 2-thiolation protein 1 [Chionoecetes opilio]|uniref:Cytoplasmic tRNA 2-thiolation protein 1 n=1 Tax=Chionoecetes opilio TaxID=41210 RepID=A0A8J4Y808_CHIOP|nr:Cytoplasmic tRNA 2-thiolation protein 1 [Chionoecetes opilio]